MSQGFDGFSARLTSRLAGVASFCLHTSKGIQNIAAQLTPIPKNSIVEATAFLETIEPDEHFSIQGKGSTRHSFRRTGNTNTYEYVTSQMAGRYMGESEELNMPPGGKKTLNQKEMITILAGPQY